MPELPYSQSFAYLTEVISRLRTDRIWDPDFGLSQDPEWYAKIRKDSIASFLIRFRCQLVAGTNWGFEGSTESDADKFAATLMEAAFKKIKGFKSAREMLALAFLRGTTWSRIGGDWRDIDVPGFGTNRLWVPTQLRDVDKRRFEYRRVSQEPLKHQWFFAGSNLSNRSRWAPVEKAHWVHHVYHPDEASLGWGRGIAEALWFILLYKTEAMQRGMAFLERWAEGFLTAAIDQLDLTAVDATAQARARAWLDLLAQMRSQHVAVHGKSDEIKLHDGSTIGWNTVQDSLGYCDNSMSRLILGAVLPTGGASDKGSLARAAVESDSTAALVASDRELLAEAITESLVRLVWTANAPFLRSLGLTDANMPQFVIRHVEEHDPGERAGTVNTLVQAGLGGWIKVHEVLEQTGFTPARPGEETITPTAATRGGEDGGGEAGASLPQELPEAELQTITASSQGESGGALAKSLLEIARAVHGGDIDGATGRAIVRMSFPQLSAEMIAHMIPDVNQGPEKAPPKKTATAQGPEAAQAVQAAPAAPPPPNPSSQGDSTPRFGVTAQNGVNGPSYRATIHEPHDLAGLEALDSHIDLLPVEVTTP